jgi:hypothetical protein
MAQDFIVDPETRKNVAFVRDGGVFCDNKEGAKIAIVLNAYLYSLNGALVGHLDGQHVIETSPRSFRKLLEGRYT